MTSESKFKEAIVKYLVSNMIYDGNPMSASEIQNEVEGGWEFAPQTVRGLLKQLIQDRNSKIHAVKRPGNNYGVKKWYYFTSEEKETKPMSNEKSKPANAIDLEAFEKAPAELKEAAIGLNGILSGDLDQLVNGWKKGDPKMMKDAIAKIEYGLNRIKAHIKVSLYNRL